jgi:C1A family cysteine protease
LTQHHYGYIPDLKDKRDHRFQILEGQVLPQQVDLRTFCPPVEDQGQLGSCTSFATGAAIRVARKVQGLQDFVTSHLFLYYNSRAKNQKSVDAGATIRGAIQAAGQYGDCPEPEWPYDINKFASKPPTQAYQDALKDRAISYLRVSQSVTQMKACLAQGFPIVIGFTVYDSFESNEVAKTGMVPMPSQNESVLGGHAILVVGYRDSDQKWIFRNSWSDQWGDKGYGYFDYKYLVDRDLASDFWTIRTISA